MVSDLIKTTQSFMTETRSSIRNLEGQVGQLSKKITELPPSTLPSNTEENPKGECKAINMAEFWEEGEAVNATEEGLTGRPLASNEFPNEEPWESEAQTEIIEIPLDLLLPFMSSDEYSSSEEDEYVTEEHVARYLGDLIKLNAKLFGTKRMEEEPLVFSKELKTLTQ